MNTILSEGSILHTDSLFLTENKFDPECVEVWLHIYYQVAWQCDFQLMKFPFETVVCEISFHLREHQLWEPNNLSINIPVFSNLPYMVSTISSPLRHTYL